MTKEELAAFYDKLTELTEHGTEESVRAYVNDQYPRLPENVRNEILFNTLLTSAQDELQEGRVIDKIQEEGLAAAEALEQVKVEIQQESKEG